MGLAKNVYRRQATYWWRRRFVVAGRSHTIAISLKVQTPAAARRIADALNARAYGVAQRLEWEMSTIESARDDLVAEVAVFTWTLDPSAAAALDALAKRPRSIPIEDLPLSSEQEHSLLVAMGRQAEAELARTLTLNWRQAVLDGIGGDPSTDAALSERAFAVIYRAIAAAGATARLNDRDRAALADRFAPEMIGFIEREIAFHAGRERLTDWSLGPPRRYFDDQLRAHGIVPTLGHVRLLRQDYLLLMVALLERPERRDQPSLLASVLRELAIGVPASPLFNAESTSSQVGSEDVQPAIDPARVTAVSGAIMPVPPPGKNFTAHVATLIRQNVKAGVWQQKTADQHQSVARMFAKLVGSDDPRDMSQAHIGAFRSLLDDLPKNWGKSPADGHRTIDEITARAQDLDETEVGLAPGTIDRQLTQLSNILSHLRDNGHVIGEVTSNMRTGGAHCPRAIFSSDDLEVLMTSSVWTGCVGVDDRLSPGEVVIRDALYWVPILGHYELGRLHELCGLMVDDIDFERHAILIQDNAERTLKTPGSHRRLPAVAEVVRLGFFDYCRDVRDAGHELVFPCLRRRGERTPLSNLFYKEFKKILISLLPFAAERRQSFHSLRKAGNTQMINANINDPIRHAVMGHAHSGTNTRHYLDDVYDEAKILALNSVPVITRHLAPFVSASRF